MESSISTLSKNIKAYRKQQGLTQQQLALVCGLQTTYVAGVERGTRNITLESLDAIALGLGKSSEELLRKETVHNYTIAEELIIERFIDSSNSVFGVVKKLNVDLQDIKSILSALDNCTSRWQHANFDSAESKELSTQWVGELSELMQEVGELLTDVTNMAQTFDTHKKDLQRRAEILYRLLRLVELK